MGMLFANDWIDYELVDSGQGAKLERWGQFLTVRPDPRAIWKRTLSKTEWEECDAHFVNNEDSGEWQMHNSPPTPWQISYNGLKFNLKPTDFRHVGIFPEQAANWNWLQERLHKTILNDRPRVLNLFAYTGGATLACLKAGAHVTHVDSSKPAMLWASENVTLSKLDKQSVRWIQDDAVKFVKREIRRGVKYDGIIMDPPRFGHGTRGEVWKLADNLSELIQDCANILSDNPAFFLVNAYTADLSPIAIEHVIKDALKFATIESGEVGLKETASGKILPAGIFGRAIFD